MRLGVSGAFLPEHMDELTVAHARRVRALGASGVFTRFTAQDPLAVTEAQSRRVRELLDAEGVEMFQATGYRPCLVHPDESERRAAVRTLREALRIAGRLGATSIDTGPGSLSTDGPWAPHPYNFTAQALRQLIKSLREAASAAEEHGVLLCVEGHRLVTLSSADITAELLDAVDSPWVKTDFDPANWIGIDTIYESGPAIEAMAATLAGKIATAHVKDVVLRPGMMLHIDYCSPGEGTMDIGALLRVMEAVSPAAPVIIEAVEDDELDKAAAHLLRIADEQGIEVVA